jgi:hypothetical protein
MPIPMIVRLAALALVSCIALPAAAQVDPLLRVHDGDPLLLASVVERLGDAAILDRLTDAHPLAVRTLAARATPFLHAPEQALGPLAELSASRDPDLAPTAMRALLTIARSMTRASLDAHEDDGASIEAARTALTPLVADEHARPDLRRGAEAVLAMLAAF